MTNFFEKKEKLYTLHYDMGNNLYLTVELLVGSDGQKEVYTVRNMVQQGILLVALAHRDDECTYIDHLYYEQDDLLKLFIKYMLEYNMYMTSLVAIPETLLDASILEYYDFFESWETQHEGYLLLDAFRCYDDPLNNSAL